MLNCIPTNTKNIANVIRHMNNLVGVLTFLSSFDMNWDDDKMLKGRVTPPIHEFATYSMEDGGVKCLKDSDGRS